MIAERLAVELTSLEAAGASWRGLAGRAVQAAGLQAAWTKITPNKDVVGVSGLVVKTGPAHQVEAARRMAGALGRSFAEILHAGRTWFIQEAVEPLPRAPAFARELAARGAFDVTLNTGRRADGSLCAFDGFIRRSG